MEYSAEESAYRDRLLKEIEDGLEELGLAVKEPSTKLHLVKDLEVDEK